MSRPHVDPSVIPDGIAPDAAQTWPPRELIDSFLGSFDFSATSDSGGEELTEFRSVLGRFASGVTIVTASTVNGPVGMTLQSFTALSLRPPLILFAPASVLDGFANIDEASRQRIGALERLILAANEQDSPGLVPDNAVGRQQWRFGDRHALQPRLKTRPWQARLDSTDGPHGMAGPSLFGETPRLLKRHR